MQDRTGRGNEGRTGRTRDFRSAGALPAAVANPQVGPIPVEIQRPTTTVVREARMGYSPAGSLTSGVPAPGNLHGVYDINTNVQFKARPTVNVATFNTRLTEAFRALAPQVTLGQPMRVDVGGSEAIPGGTPGWWVTIQGRIQSATPVSQETVRRALARAFWQSSTWTAQSGVTVPADGAEMQNALNRSNACSGGMVAASFVPRACMRYQSDNARTIEFLARGANPPPAPTPVVAPTPAPSTPAGPSAPAPQTPAAPSAQPCTIRAAAQFWLRPRATFEREGPQMPAGTQVTITGPGGATQGSLQLFPIRVADGRTGFAAFNAAEVAMIRACATPPSGPGAPMVVAPSAPAPSAPATPRPPAAPSTPAPAPGAPPANPLAVIRQQPSSQMSTTLKYAAGALLATGVVGGIALYATSKPSSRAQKGRTS